MEEMGELFSRGGQVHDIDRQFVASWLTHFQHAVSARAEALGCQPRDLACTFLAAVVGEQAAAFVQVGDGAIVVADPREPEGYCWIFWPQRGEYENVTAFITDPSAEDHLAHEVEDRRYDEIALFSDGLQRLALHFSSHAAHNPFFRPMFSHLRPAPPGYLAQESDALAIFLDSAAVNERTDDDKTLVLATRRPHEAPAPAGKASMRAEGGVQVPSNDNDAVVVDADLPVDSHGD
jgi:hypothetical protein